ncbi:MULTISPECIES: hypothetical protein [Prauserella]|uniref:Uncharacterized protein n=2 Tax=Prauserella TaxID=142577 RepID=A0A318L9A1_9PSEU|nr:MULTISPECIES: hypothetical protein [Prauserella]PXY17742.1 hypothetical protein BA062_36955 [Prauserella flavalba]PXY18648.1 hypothetical protein BAY59_33805 [Prauserella coralliicola]TKG63581.1 hypothetical protein FCN18_30255 [Prauserella endophytica]
MATTEEIERRVEQADAARSAKRSAVAKRVGELAQQRASIAEQLSDIERELGDVLAESTDVMEIAELARFTDIPAADLNRWLGSRKATRSKRKKPAGRASSTKSAATPASSTRDTPAADAPSTRRKPPAPGDDTANASDPVTTEVG